LPVDVVNRAGKEGIHLTISSEDMKHCPDCRQTECKEHIPST
jgi:hypothetical protein